MLGQQRQRYCQTESIATESTSSQKFKCYETVQNWRTSRRRRVAVHPASNHIIPCRIIPTVFIILFHLLAFPSITNSSTILGNRNSIKLTSSEAPQSTVKFTPEDRAQLRQAFLHKFGLDEMIPSTSEGALRKRSSGPEGRPHVPDYIWDLYKAHSTSQQAAQIIRHYGGPSAIHPISNGRIMLTFNLSATGRDPEKEEVARAELRLPDWKMPTNGSLSISHKTVEDNPEGEEEEAATKQWTDFERQPWMDLDGHIFDQKINKTSRMDELHLMLHFPIEIAQEEASRMLQTAALIIYSNEREKTTESEEGNSEEPKSRQRRRIKRRASSQNSSGSSNERGGRQRSTSGSSSRIGGGSSSTGRASNAAASAAHHRHHRQHTAGLCLRSELYVDFSELNWQDWIMAPTGYDAYQCKGRCVHPMPAQLNSTNHALVQSLIHSIDPARAPAPSCVPVQMSAISILYRDVNDVIVVKTYPDMRVDACGCH